METSAPTEAELRSEFPRLAASEFAVASDDTDAYNCIAFAAGDTERWWWPTPAEPQHHWPPAAPRELSLSAFERAFGTLGYRRCGSDELEDGYEKIVIYATPGRVPTHAARQLPDGRWASKLGDEVDIVHNGPDDVAGKWYGEVEVVMQRQKRAFGIVPGRVLRMAAEGVTYGGRVLRDVLRRIAGFT